MCTFLINLNLTYYFVGVPTPLVTNNTSSNQIGHKIANQKLPTDKPKHLQQRDV